MQADTIVQFPNNTQAYNRYVLNNPLTHTYPSGHILPAVVGLAAYAGGWSVGQAAVAVGFASFFHAAFGGANFGDALLAGVSSTALTYAGGELFGNVGDFGLNSETLFAAATVGTVGGISSALQGGKFGHGFLSAGVGGAVGSGFGGALGNSLGNAAFAMQNTEIKLNISIEMKIDAVNHISVDETKVEIQAEAILGQQVPSIYSLPEFLVSQYQGTPIPRISGITVSSSTGESLPYSNGVQFSADEAIGAANLLSARRHVDTVNRFAVDSSALFLGGAGFGIRNAINAYGRYTFAESLGNFYQQPNYVDGTAIGHGLYTEFLRPAGHPVIITTDFLLGTGLGLLPRD